MKLDPQADVFWMLTSYANAFCLGTLYVEKSKRFRQKWACLLDYAKRDFSNNCTYSVLSLFTIHSAHWKKHLLAFFPAKSKCSMVRAC